MNYPVHTISTYRVKITLFQCDKELFGLADQSAMGALQRGQSTSGSSSAGPGRGSLWNGGCEEKNLGGL